MKKFIISLLSVVALLSCTKNEGVRVMSYNLRYGLADDGENSWELRREASVRMLEDIRPDCFGVQEALDFQIDYLLDNTDNYKYVGVGREDGKKSGECMAIFYSTSSIELLDWGTYWLSETPDVPSRGWDAACRRTATWTLLKHKSSGKLFFYVNTHLDHVGQVARKEGLSMVVRNISSMNPNNYPMILTGDFNVFPDDPCLEPLDRMMTSARKAAVDSDEAGSFNNWENDRGDIIDYIYFKGFSGCSNFKVVREKYGDVPFISDHYPIYSDLVF